MKTINVSIQAFLEEIQSWTFTLNRQIKKLKAIKTTVQNKFKLNSIQIVLIEIQSLHIKYKKVKNKYQTFITKQNQSPNFQTQNFKAANDQLLNDYSQLSKSFMDILQKVSLIEAESDLPNLLIKENDKAQKGKKKAQSTTKPEQKTFLNETFAFKMSKEPKTKKNKSIFEKRNIQKEKQLPVKNNNFRAKAQSMISNINEASNVSISTTTRNKQQQKTTNLTIDNDQDTNLWQIRHQLGKITQMMKEMKNQIKFHQHQQTNKQINKIESKNRKIASELKSIKDENRLMLDKIEELKRELMQEKKQQVDLINKFEKKSLVGNAPTVYNSRATHNENYGGSLIVAGSPGTNLRSQQQLQYVSDWVKMRI